MSTPAAPDSVTQILGGDHRRLDAMLADVKRCLCAGELGQAAARFRRFRGGLERHIAIEEEILFPAFESMTGRAHDGPTGVMRAEHLEIRRLMSEVAAHLESEGDGSLTSPLAVLTARIYAHNGKEERILYPAIDRANRDAGVLGDLVQRLAQP
jgi:iron-sulfur cluster repair protein YtfE (RIC family)